MYNSILTFLIALTIVSLSPAETRPGGGYAGLLRIPLIVFGVWGLLRWRFRRMMIAAINSSAATAYYRPLVSGMLQRYQLWLTVPFALLIFSTPFPALVIAPLAKSSELLGSLAGLLPFFFFLIVLWWEVYPLKSVLLGQSTSRKSFVLSNARTEFSILVPWFLIALIGDGVFLLFPSLERAIEANPFLEFLYAPFFLLAVAIFLPVAITAMWGCRPVPEGRLRERLTLLTKHMGLRVREIMVWPLMEGKILTAGIIGLVPRFRYLLITPALLNALDEDEISAVVAHEAGHVRYNHLWFYLLFFAGLLISLMSLLYELVDLAAIWARYAHPGLFADGSAKETLSLTVAIMTIAVLFVGFRYAFGAISRSFERQADLYSLEVLNTFRPFNSALETISRYSGDIRDLPSWHHGSLGERMDFLAAASEDPSLVEGHHRKVRNIKRLMWTILAVVTLCAGAMQAPGVGESVRRGVAIAGLDGYIAANPGEAGPLVQRAIFLADERRESEALADLKEAVALEPENPVVLNALAWTLSTAKDETLRDCPRAVKIAEKAVASMPLPALLDTLAEARYCAGDREGALEAINLAVEGAKRGENLAELEYFMGQKKRFEEKN
jgi:Zn-dependent protease with chaperone function